MENENNLKLIFTLHALDNIFTQTRVNGIYDCIIFNSGILDQRYYNSPESLPFNTGWGDVQCTLWTDSYTIF